VLEREDDNHDPVFRYPSSTGTGKSTTTNASGAGAAVVAGGNTARKEDANTNGGGLGRGFTYDDVGMRGAGVKKNSSRQQQSRMAGSGNTSDDEYKVVDEMRGERIPVTDLP
jgi:hypothetical protein